MQSLRWHGPTGRVFLRLFFPTRSYNFLLSATAVVTVCACYDGSGQTGRQFLRRFSQCGHIGRCFLRPLWLGELLHGLLEGGAADAHEKVNRVAGQFGSGASPVMVLDDDLAAPLAGDGVVVVAAGFELVTELFEDRLERDLACGPDFRLRPGTTA